MKKSARVTLTVVAAMGLAACSRRRDPCQTQYFDETACADAVRNGGYYWGGTWYPMRCSYPYPYYYDQYRTHISRGGSVSHAPSGSYAAPAAGKRFGTGGSVSSPGVTRGGFGSIGAGHGAGA
jgi:hypothetical protein